MIDVRPATASQAALLSQWAVREGWGAGVDDIPAFYAADPEGFLLAWRDGVPVGSISAVKYDGGYFFVGYYIVDPALRGRGIGHALFDAAHERIGDAPSGLDGVPAQVDTYASLGYVPTGSTARWRGAADAVLALPVTGMCRPLQPSDVAALVAYDAEFVPAPRERFVRAWVSPPRRTFVSVDEAGAIVGYACVRPTVGQPGADGEWRIGPLFADDDAVARALLAACARAAAGGQLAIDVPDANAAALALAESLGMTPGFSCTRMYRGDVRPIPLERVWGSTSFELG